MVRVANSTGLPIGATMLVGLPVILSNPRSKSVVPGALASGCGGAGGASGAIELGAVDVGAAASGLAAGAGEGGAGWAIAAAIPESVSHPITSGVFTATVRDSAQVFAAALAPWRQAEAWWQTG